jgi:hypothetical protein
MGARENIRLSTEICLLRCTKVTHIGKDIVQFSLLPRSYGDLVYLRIEAPHGKYIKGDQVRMTLEPEPSHTLDP